MIGQREFLEQLVQVLKRNHVAFMVSGSIASSFHGEPRATRDVDLVVDCSREQLVSLLDAVQDLGWYVNPDAAMAAHAERAMFNVIDPESAWKADLIIRKKRDFSACEFERRVEAHVFGPDSTPVTISTPEDTILSKLEWSRDAHSEQQYRDALAVAVLGARRLDRDYLRRWASELRISETLEKLLAEADERAPEGDEMLERAAAEREEAAGVETQRRVLELVPEARAGEVKERLAEFEAALED